MAHDPVAVEGEVDFLGTVPLSADPELCFGTRGAAAKENAISGIHFGGRTQFIEQAPGPRGSPHAPHALGAASRAEYFGDSAPTAKTDNCFSMSALWHDGHANTVCSRTSNSKWR